MSAEQGEIIQCTNNCPLPNSNNSDHG